MTNTSYCPLCSNRNRCGYGTEQESACWCTRVEITTNKQAIGEALQTLQKMSGELSSDHTLETLTDTQACLCLSCLGKINKLVDQTL